MCSTGRNFSKVLKWVELTKFYNTSISRHLLIIHGPAGIIFAKKHLDDNPTIFKICESDVVKSNKFPKIIRPQELSEERKKYLFNKIRPLVNENCKDVLCPPIYLPIGHFYHNLY